MVGGKPWRFVGYNVPCTQPFGLPPAQQAYFFSSIARASHANAIRVWMFQSDGGPGNWGPLDQLVASAKAAGLRIIPTLANEWNTCESATAAPGSQKTLAWYQGAYKQAGDGYPLAFRDFAIQVAAHFANEPAVAFWQLVNEATAPTLEGNGQLTCNETAAAQALRSFADDMAGAIHAVDPNHLVNLGTLGGNECGTAGTDYANVQAGLVGLCEYHDYGDPFNPLYQGQPGGLADRLHQCQTLPGGGKPLFVGESGIVANVQPAPAPEPTPCSAWPNCTPAATISSLNLRASLYKAKITAAFNDGIAGYQIWFKQNYYSAANDPYAIGSGDPTEAMMASITTLNAPAAAVPETATPVLLPISAGAIALLAVGGGVVTGRRRHPARSG
jgi:hypothetical protein